MCRDSVSSNDQTSCRVAAVIEAPESYIAPSVEGPRSRAKKRVLYDFIEDPKVVQALNVY